MEHFNTPNSVTGIRVGTVYALPTVAEDAAYLELTVGDDALVDKVRRKM